MEIKPVPDQEPMPEDRALPELEATPAEESLAWESLGGGLWLPRRIRGSWRGGVLG